MRAQLSLIENEYRVHPAAAIFPMMSDAELQELAADIKENGLLIPIVLDKSGEVLIDGRNRLRACEMAGVKPTFQQYDGDPVGYIISTNVARRHMSKSQIAMTIVKLRPDPSKGGRGNKLYPEDTVSRQAASHARLVIAHTPDLADAVILGQMSLKDAYEKAQAIKKQLEEDAGWMARFREEEPDLAEAVEAGSMPMTAAREEWNRRFYSRREEENREEDQRRTATELLQSFVMLLCPTGKVQGNWDQLVKRAQEQGRGYITRSRRKHWNGRAGFDLSKETIELAYIAMKAVHEAMQEDLLDD